MPKVTVDHKCQLQLPEAFEKIKAFFETDKDIRRLDPNLDCLFDAKSMTGKINGKQFKAEIKLIEEKGGSLIAIVVDLPLMLSPFKGKVQEMIQKKLIKYMA